MTKQRRKELLDDAPWSHPALLGKMRDVQWDPDRGEWRARARGKPSYASATTAGAAMQQALNIPDQRHEGTTE